MFQGHVFNTARLRLRVAATAESRRTVSNSSNLSPES
jgi:hypothetical protein